ncbi:ATP-binding protein [Streptomyces sp. JJ66]|uniref:ATP-binding protein n=1 Tax=Streptomyces sp. JJ66 TaxID=2803843 RepID=UPI001C5774C2|nr:ATP-binding protein [Streptomyces sp. JJ66]MBW1604621.1 ATP-binding protein [Streptomyces sp. JJ66]
MNPPAFTALAAPPPLDSADWWFSLRLSNDPQAPGIARTHLRTTLDAYGLDTIVDTAELLTSEVVTNAHRYTDGPVTVRAQYVGTRRRLRVSTGDVSAVAPRLACALPADEGGRGLRILDLCALSWGWFPLSDSRDGLAGKVVWYELAAP